MPTRPDYYSWIIILAAFIYMIAAVCTGDFR
jgi:hypothetical protein